MKTNKIGIIGCGKQAGKHISGLKKIPGVEVVLCDKEPPLAEALAEKTGCSWVKDPKEIFGNEALEGVVVCTPTHSHASLIMQAVQAEKAVFCEKPVSESPPEIESLSSLVNGMKRIALIGYVYRHVPVFEEGAKIFREHSVDSGNLIMGKPLSAFFRIGGRGSHQAWKHKKASGGGAINEMLVHMVDLANWYFGPLVEVEVVSCDLRYAKRNINGEWVSADAEDYILVRLRGRSGIEIFCQADLITPAFTQYVEIQAENGTFMGSIQQDMPSYIFLKEDAGGFGAGKTVIRYGQRNIFDVQMLYFIHCILKQEVPDKNTIDDSLELINVMNQISIDAAGRFDVTAGNEMTVPSR